MKNFRLGLLAIIAANKTELEVLQDVEDAIADYKEAIVLGEKPIKFHAEINALLLKWEYGEKPNMDKMLKDLDKKSSIANTAKNMHQNFDDLIA